MMMKPRVIRLWGPAILLAGITVGASSERLEAQSTPSASQAGQSATKSLLDKARDLEAHGRLDLAVQTWQQVLLAEPMNTEALGNLARAYKLEGDTKLASSYLERLRTISPSDPNIARVEQTEVPHNQKAKLQEAAKLSDAGKYSAAMAIYRQLFGSHPPAGDWAVAYYETESAAGGGRPQAIEGLRGLVERYPSDPREVPAKPAGGAGNSPVSAVGRSQSGGRAADYRLSGYPPGPPTCRGVRDDPAETESGGSRHGGSDGDTGLGHGRPIHSA
jgi:tetratricopeptide (TPR) repeat protein